MNHWLNQSGAAFRLGAALILVAAFGAATAGHCADPFLVRNLDPRMDMTESSNADRYLTIGSYTYFIALDSAHGKCVFKSDGTAAGTTILQEGTWPTALGSIGSMLLIFTDSGLYWSDGTAAGTTQLNSNFYNPFEMGNAGPYLFFGSEDVVGWRGIELFVTNGTGGGTMFLKDIDPDGVGYPREMKGLGDLLFFDGNDSNVSGDEPWVSDGTEAGTRMLGDLISGTRGSMPRFFTPIGSTMYFWASQMYDYGLFRSDGTPEATSLVRGGFRLRSSADAHMTGFQGKLFFCAAATTDFNEELWTSDGTLAGTVLFKELEPGLGASRPTAMLAIGSTLYFVTRNETSGHRLWKSDGTAAGTTIVKQLYAAGYDDANPMTFVPREVAGKLVLFAKLPGAGWQLWASDGTPDGTAVISRFDMPSDADGIHNPIAAQAANGKLLFSTKDAVHGIEPWVTDGTAEGTQQLLELKQTTLDASKKLVSCRGRVFFTLKDSVHGEELWSSDGTLGGTAMVADINAGAAGSAPRCLTSFMNKLYFIADDGAHGAELWCSDGTAAGTTLYADLEPGSGSPFTRTSSDWCFAAGHRLYFEATTSAQGHGVYSIDGDAPGQATLMAAVTPYKPFVANPRLRTMCDWGGRFFFAASEPVHGIEPWISDGTPAGTRMIKDITPGAENTTVTMPTAMGSRLFFLAGTNGPDIYKTDGTAAGTSSFYKVGYIPYEDLKVEYMFACSPTRAALHFRWDVITTDGTSGGTRMAGGGDRLFLPFNGYVYYLGGFNNSGNELCRVGAAGYYGELVKDICPGAYVSSNPDSMVVFDNKLYFAATEPVNGRELWTSDGTGAGTLLRADLNPGTGGSSPDGLTVSGEQLFFFANDGGPSGLWALPTANRAGEDVDVATGDSAPISSATAGVTADFSSNSAAGVLTMAKFDAMAPGRSSDLTGYWLLSGLADSTFAVTLTFDYDPSAVAALGLNEADLRLIRSLDGGRTWTEIASTVSTGAHTIGTASAQSSLGMWAISAADRTPSTEIWVNFYWNLFEAGTALDPFNTLFEGASAVASGGRVKVNAGTSLEQLRLTKPMRIEPVGGPVRIGAN